MRRLVITSDAPARTPSEVILRRIADLEDRWTEDAALSYELSRQPVGLSGRRLETYARSAGLADDIAAWNTGRAEFCGPTAMQIAPDLADRLVAGSRLLSEMADCEPALGSGLLQTDRQHWVGDGRQRPIVPHKELCRVPSAETDRMAIPAFWSAFYTSTAMTSGYSMWRALMSCDDSDAFFRRLPWHTWRMDVDDDVCVAEVKDAVAWTDLVTAYSVTIDGMVWPDWPKIAEVFDAVHFTWPFIVAAQGLAFTSDLGVIARAFWDLECTLWLKWRFTGTHMVEKFDGD